MGMKARKRPYVYVQVRPKRPPPWWPSAGNDHWVSLRNDGEGWTTSDPTQDSDCRIRRSAADEVLDHFREQNAPRKFEYRIVEP